MCIQAKPRGAAGDGRDCAGGACSTILLGANTVRRVEISLVNLDLHRFVHCGLKSRDKECVFQSPR